MFTAEPSLADLAASSGLEPRTIRSWVAQGLLPPPLSRGPAARYPADTLSRLLAIRTMRDALGMSLTDIRKELLVASPEQIAAYASRAETVAKPSQATGNPASSALDYIASLRARAPQPAPFLTAEATPPRPRTATGIEALEHRLGQGRPEPARKARAEEWLRIPVTPDVELTVRGPLDAEQRMRLERCADLIRDILLGRDR
ncbi:MerR family transcriptional regulator [Rhodoplanes serenus]|uniref:MerR family transcriptional regulator n=1 Tax=Rhodoplanes serenus TaxID=200615 RepID=A0A9X4XNA3_9BRAD|nr:helix-turn-helix domain-containing protein [Rhodoplanes serenus]MTW18368.1 MerR family transcriptional regulator [Rhodoplanes serenus]